MGIYRGYASSDGAAGGKEGIAAVVLPIGATVTRLACTSRVLTTGSVLAVLYSYDSNGVETVHAQVTTPVTGVNYVETQNTTIGFPLVPVNRDYSIGIAINGGAAEENRLKGCGIDYTVDAVIP